MRLDEPFPHSNPTPEILARLIPFLSVDPISEPSRAVALAHEVFQGIEVALKAQSPGTPLSQERVERVVSLFTSSTRPEPHEAQSIVDAAVNLEQALVSSCSNEPEKTSFEKQTN